MSNKLKKRSADYEKIKEDLKEKIKKEGGLNITPDTVRSYVELEEGSEVTVKESELTCTYDEFFEIISELSNDGYFLFKIVQVHNGKETRGLTLCDKDTKIAFVKVPENEK